ncbi:MAG: putative Ig domain-containing protein [Bryobacteraceae bacterium]
MTHASLCKRTYKNSSWFQGSRFPGIRALGSFCIFALLFLASGNALLQAQSLTITPTTLPSGLVGQGYLTQLSASGGVAPYSFSLGSFSNSDTGLPPGVTLNANGNGAITGIPTSSGTFSFTVQVNDQDDGIGTADIQVTIAPMTISTMFLPGATTGVPYSVQLQVNGGVAPITWSIQCTTCTSRSGPKSAVVPLHAADLPAGLTLNQNTGVISGTPTASGLFQFTVIAVDQDNNRATQLLGMEVSTCAPTVTPASPLPPGEVKVNYPQVTFAAFGCTGPFTFTAQGVSPFNPSALPPGLILSANGALTGTPTTAGMFGFVLDVTDPNQNVTQLQYSITIYQQPAITTQSPLPNGLVNVPYSQQIAAAGGVPPYVFSMNNNPPGITITQGGVLNGTPTKAGTYNFNIGVTDSLRAQTVSPFQVTFVTPTTQIQVSPLGLTFNADLNGEPPPTQAIAIVPATGATLPISYSVIVDSGQSGTAAPAWITVTPTSGGVPAGLVVSVNQGTMAAGSYSARIQVLDTFGLATDVAVTLDVANIPQQLTVASSMLNFAARSATPGNLVENLLVSSSGPGSLNFTASVVGKSPWITSLTPASGTTTPNAPVFVQVQVNTSGLAVGAYNDTILVSSSAGNIPIPVSLFVAASGPILALDTTGVLFQAIAGGGSTATQNINVLNLGDPSSTVSWSATVVSGSNWLSLVSSSGTATSSAPGVLTLALAPNATQLTPGPYYAIVEITDANSRNSPQYITAVLNLQPGNAAPAPYLAPGGLFFTTSVGGAVPAAQEVQINTSSTSTVSFTAAASTFGTGNWLITPVAGPVSGQQAASIAVAVDPTGLAAGIYSGDVNVSIGSLLQSVNVTFVVQPASSLSAISSLRPHAAGCAASKLAITETGLANNFAVPAGWPATLIVQLNDDCADPITNGNVVASFSNGDAPLNLVGDSLGNYSTTWQPGGVNANMVVTLNATAGGLQPATAKLYGGIAQNPTPPPTIVPGGALNNLNPVVGAPLAPGTIAQVYGGGLASAAVSTGVLPLPTTFNNTFALVGPAQAPLYFLSNGQINIQIPYEATATQQTPIVLSVNNALTLPLMLNIVPSSPGVLSADDGPAPTVQNGAHIIAQHADFSLVSSSSPAKPGEYLVMYLVGLGDTNPSVASGAPAPTSPLASVTVTPTVTVGGTTATVAFAGLTPGFVGLYQINFQVPTGAASGELEVDVTQNGVAANPTLLPVSN